MDFSAKLKANLLAKHGVNLHLRFFDKNPSLEFFKVSTVTPYDIYKRLIPFRNSTCTKPECIYDIETLVEKCQSLSYRSLNGFVCEKCHIRVELKNLFHDDYLQRIIDSLWSSNETPNRGICPSVIIKRDGTWQPETPKKNKNYMDTLLSGMKRTQSKRSGSQGFNSMNGTWRGGESSIVCSEKSSNSWESYGNTPHLCEYNQDEFETLLQVFEESVVDDKPLFERGDDSVSKRDVWKLENDEVVTSGTIGMFAGYLNILQKIYTQVYNSRNNNRCYTVAISVLSYDRYTKTTKYSFISKNEEYKQNSEEFLDDYDRLTLVIYYDERWIVAVFEIVESHLTIADFLAEDLSKVKIREITDIIKQILKLQFYNSPRTSKIADVPKMKFLSDCGIYAMSFAYKCMNNASIDSLSIKFWEKELFKKQILWLLLKLKDCTNKESKPPSMKKGPTASSSNVSLTSKQNSSQQLLRLPSSESIQVESGARLRVKSYNNIPDDRSEASQLVLPSKVNLRNIVSGNSGLNMRSSGIRQPQSLNVSPRDQVRTPKQAPVKVFSNPQGAYSLGRVKDSIAYNKLRLADSGGDPFIPGFDPGLSAISKSESVKNLPRMREVASMTNLDTSILSKSIEQSIKRKEPVDIAGNGKNGMMQVGRNASDQSRRGESHSQKVVRKLDFNNDDSQIGNTSILPAIEPKKKDSYRSLSSMLHSKLPDPRRFAPARGMTSIDIMRLNDSDIDDKESEKEDDDASRSIILFAFQEPNQPPSRINIDEETQKVKGRAASRVKSDGIKKEVKQEEIRMPAETKKETIEVVASHAKAKSLTNIERIRRINKKEQELPELDDADLFDYAGGKNKQALEKLRQRARDKRKLQAIREGHDEEEQSPMKMNFGSKDSV